MVVFPFVSVCPSRCGRVISRTKQSCKVRFYSVNIKMVKYVLQHVFPLFHSSRQSPLVNGTGCYSVCDIVIVFSLPLLSRVSQKPDRVSGVLLEERGWSLLVSRDPSSRPHRPLDGRWPHLSHSADMPDSSNRSHVPNMPNLLLERLEQLERL